MKRMIFALLASTVATPALAQHAGHTQQAPVPTAAQRAAPPCLPEHAAMGHCTLPTPAPAPTPAPTCLPEHAAMGHCRLPAQAPAAPAAPAPNATCLPEHAAMGRCTLQSQSPPTASPAPATPPTCLPEHAAMGHCTPSPPSPPPASVGADPHAGYNMPMLPAAPGANDPQGGHQMGGSSSQIPVGETPSEALLGPAHAQDLVYDPSEAERSRQQLRGEHGGMAASKFLIDQLEAIFGDGGEGYFWNGQFWYGGDIDKFVLSTEGDGSFRDGVDQAEVQALWSHAIDPWFDLRAGVRQDFGQSYDRTHLVLGVQGLAPYWFQIEAAAFLSAEGEVTARFEGEYDLRITQQLIVQPRLELNLSLQDMPDIRIGSGVSTAALGARLRYELFPSGGLAVIAPYVGVEYEQAFGRTKDFRIAAGEDAGGVRFVMGVRTWF